MNVRHFLDTGGVFSQDLQTLLASHPESFDVLVYPALPPEQDESTSLATLEVGRLDSEEREQSYGSPVAAKAYIIPEDGYSFPDAVEDGGAESFAVDGFRMLLSKVVRRYSLVTWQEWTDLTMSTLAERCVYVESVKPLGRTLSVGSLCKCVPIPDLGLLEELEEANG